MLSMNDGQQWKVQNGRRVEVGAARASQEPGFSDFPQRVEGLQTRGRSNSFQPFL